MIQEKAPRASRERNRERPEYFLRLYHKENPTMLLNIVLKWAWDEGKQLGRRQNEKYANGEKMEVVKNCGINVAAIFWLSPSPISHSFSLRFRLRLAPMSWMKIEAPAEKNAATRVEAWEAIYVNYDPIMKSTGSDGDESVCFNKFVFNFNAAISYRSLISEMFYSAVVKGILIRNASMTSFEWNESRASLLLTLELPWNHPWKLGSSIAFDCRASGQGWASSLAWKP